MSRRNSEYYDLHPVDLIHKARTTVYLSTIQYVNLRAAICLKLKELGKVIRNKPEWIPCMKKLYKVWYSELSSGLNRIDKIYAMGGL